MSEWQEYEIQELFTVQNGYAFRSSQYIEFEEDALEVLKMGHIERGGGLGMKIK
jgi:type I restriction enzyme S subunit